MGLGPGEPGEERCRGCRSRSAPGQAGCVCVDTDKGKLRDVLNQMTAGQRSESETKEVHQATDSNPNQQNTGRLPACTWKLCNSFQPPIETDCQTPPPLASVGTFQTVAQNQCRNSQHVFLRDCTPIPELALLHLPPPPPLSITIVNSFKTTQHLFPPQT